MRKQGKEVFRVMAKTGFEKGDEKCHAGVKEVMGKEGMLLV